MNQSKVYISDIERLHLAHADAIENNSSITVNCENYTTVITKNSNVVDEIEKYLRANPGGGFAYYQRGAGSVL